MDDATIKFEPLSPDSCNTTYLDDTLTEPYQHSGPLTPIKLVRNAKVHSINDYAYIFKKLQLTPDFYNQFFYVMNDYRSREDVRNLLADSEEDVKAISEHFLAMYGRKIWMKRGTNNMQDPKFRETFFKWNEDEEKLWPILDELWMQVRRLLWSPTGVQNTLVIRQSTPNRLTGTASAASSMSLEDEELIAVRFINKVRKEIHGLPGNVMPRKFLFPRVEKSRKYKGVDKMLW